MKIGKLFDVINDGNDLVALFENVDTVEQMVSRLERLKQRQMAEEMLLCIVGLRSSVGALLDESLEMSASLDDDDDDPADAKLDAELEQIANEAEVEPEADQPSNLQNPPSVPATENTKSSVPT